MTRIFCILRELYGSGVEKLRMDARSFQAPSGKKLEIQTFSSNYHVQLSPGQVTYTFLKLLVLEVNTVFAVDQELRKILD